MVRWSWSNFMWWSLSVTYCMLYIFFASSTNNAELHIKLFKVALSTHNPKGRRGRDRMDLCNQCISQLMLWIWIPIRGRCTTSCDKVCQWLSTGRWFSLGPPVSSTNKTDRHDITEILLKVASKTNKRNNNLPWQFPFASFSYPVTQLHS